jgi:hypothetical protein
VKARLLLRWLVIGGCGGYGAYTLVECLILAVRYCIPFDVGSAALVCLGLPFAAIYCGWFIGMAYFVFRRRYKRVCELVAALAAVVALSAMFSVFRRLGLEERVFELSKDPERMAYWVLPGLLISFAQLVAPFYAAAWTYRFGHKHLPKTIRDYRQSCQALSPN